MTPYLHVAWKLLTHTIHLGFRLKHRQLIIDRAEAVDDKIHLRDLPWHRSYRAAAASSEAIRTQDSQTITVSVELLCADSVVTLKLVDELVQLVACANSLIHDLGNVCQALRAKKKHMIGTETRVGHVTVLHD